MSEESIVNKELRDTISSWWDEYFMKLPGQETEENQKDSENQRDFDLKYFDTLVKDAERFRKLERLLDKWHVVRLDKSLWAIGEDNEGDTSYEYIVSIKDWSDEYISPNSLAEAVDAIKEG